MKQELFDKIVKSKDGKHSHNLRLFLKHLAKRRGVLAKDIIAARVPILRNSLVIGYRNAEGFTGCRLNMAICNGGRTIFDFYPNNYKLKELKGFWEKYLRLGVCITDSKHYFYASRWEMISKIKRKCRHCGLVQKRRIVRRVQKSEVWK